MNNLPKIIIAGEIKEEYLISATGKVVSNQSGGNLLYASSGASLWNRTNNDIGLISKVGSNFPKINIQELAEKGFKTDGIKKLEHFIEHRTFTAYSDLRTSYTKSPISYFGQIGDALLVSLLGHQGKEEENQISSRSNQGIYSEKDLPEEYCFASVAHLCPLDYLSHSLFPEVLRRAEITYISIDPGDKYMEPNLFNKIPNMLQGLTAFLPSEGELRNLFRGKTEDLWEMMEEIGTMGCSFVVVKSGENGQLLFNAVSNKKFQIPAFPSNLVDITGAGDVFCGGFIAGLNLHNDPLQAVLLGNISASFAVEGSGAFYANDILEGLQTARLEKLKNYVREI